MSPIGGEPLEGVLGARQVVLRVDVVVGELAWAYS